MGMIAMLSEYVGQDVDKLGKAKSLVKRNSKPRVLESGRSNQKKRPFVRPTVRQTKAEAIKAMDRVIQEEIEKMK